MFVNPTSSWVIMGALCLGLAGCAGGGGDAPSPVTPEILEFSADKADYVIGDKAVLTVRFTGGIGRIDPDIGAVQSGTRVETADLDGTRDLRLVVTSASGTVSRPLRLTVRYRDAYRSLSSPFVGRGHTASLTGDGSVLLIGGSRGEPTLSASIDRYDPRTGAFTKLGELRNGREGHRSVRLSDGRILVTGGNSALPVASAELVDERTGAVSAAGEPRVQRVGHTATRFGSDKVLITGGYSSGEGAELGISRTAEIWEPSTNQFRLLPATLRVARAGHTATELPDGRVLIVGGFSSDGRYELAEVFDPSTETFTALAAVDDRERGLHSLAQLPDGSLLVLGGETESTEPLASVVQFRGDDGRTSQILGDLVQPRTLVEGAVSRDGRVFLFGGETGPGNVTSNSAEAYSATTGGAPIASMPSPRVGHTTTRLPDGRFLIAGGEDGSGRLIRTALVYE